MTEQEEQLHAITEMRDLMNRSSRFISMSGLSGVAAGFFGLCGAVIAYLVLGTAFFDFPFSGQDFVEYGTPVSSQIVQALGAFFFVRTLFFVACAVLVLALFSAWFFTWRKAKKLGLSMWDDTAKRLVINLAIPLMAGGAFALVLLSHGIIGLVPGVTLMFYGMALLNASKYTLNDIRYLGIMEIFLGFVAAAYYQYSLVCWTIGFGVLHIIYGIVLYFKYEMKKGQE